MGHNVYLYILGMWAVSYLIRTLPLTLIRREITNKTVKENKLTCLMITHNMESALSTGNRTLMMSDGNIVVDVSGEERDRLQVEDLLNMFSEASGKKLDSDRILLKEGGKK